MKYMCGGPVKKATGGVIKSAAPKSVAKSAAAGKQLPTPEIAPKRQVQPTPPKDVVREAPRPTMEPKRLIAQTPPDDVKTPKAPEYLDRYAKTIGGAPKDAKTIGGAPKDAGREAARPTMAPKPAKAIPSAVMAKKGVPVASKKPMIGLKTGGHVTKSMTKW